MKNNAENIDRTNFPENLSVKNGVFIGNVNDRLKTFEKNYLAVREKEKRYFDDNTVAQLPDLKNHIHSKEWQKRRRSSRRLIEYFNHKENGLLLDVGCGNGWFSHQLASQVGMDVIGLDVNRSELEQASRVFDLPNLKFVFTDIYEESIPENYFNYITLNASVQYFQDLLLLIKRLFTIMKPGGEIHLIDSPFYRKHEVEAARQRTLDYYTKLGYPELSGNYYHHCFEELELFQFKAMYEPGRHKLINFFKKPDIPFPWIKIENR